MSNSNFLSLQKNDITPKSAFEEPSMGSRSPSEGFNRFYPRRIDPTNLKVSKTFSLVSLISAVVLIMASFVPLVGALIVLILWWLPLGAGITGWILSTRQHHNDGIKVSIAGIIGTIISVILSSLSVYTIILGLTLFITHSSNPTYYYDCTGLPNAGLCISD